MLQTDPGWLPARRGKLTASNAEDAFTKTKSGWSTTRRKLMIKLVCERAYDWAVNNVVTPPMQRGLDYQDEACGAYEAHTGHITTPAALIDHPTIENLAATPDGFISGEPALVEYKVPLFHNFIEWRLGGKIPKEHEHQLVIQLACTRHLGFEWTHFVAYCPEIKQLFIRRFAPPIETIMEYEAMAVEFLKETDQMFELYTNTPIEA